MLSYRPTLAQDFDGEVLQYPVRAWTALLYGQPAGIGGLLYKGPDAMLFARVKPLLREHPLALYKCACKLMEMIKAKDIPLIAIADKDIPRSEATLEWFGFEHTGSTEHGEMYEWMPVRAQI